MTVVEQLIARRVFRGDVISGERDHAELLVLGETWLQVDRRLPVQSAVGVVDVPLVCT